jgi:hypothetical protein
VLSAFGEEDLVGAGEVVLGGGGIPGQASQPSQTRA